MKKEFELNQIIHADCMDIMRDIPDKYFELAIVDPPYGIGVNKMNLGSGKYKTDKKWDNEIPEEKYFKELFRISKNQIIWGANYFNNFLYPSMGWIFWDKNNGTSDFSDGELAFTSFNRALRKFKFNLSQQNKSDIKNRFHPTAKPVSLYIWILQNYAKPEDKIIDTHSGSGSLAIACHLEKFDFLAIEKDIDYYNASVKRLEEIRQQGVLF